MNLCCHISDAMEGLPPRGLSCRIPSSVEYLNPNWSVTFHRTPQPFNSSQSILSESDSENDQMFLFQQRFERPLKKILITADYLDKIQWRYERYKINYSLIIVDALSSRGKLRLLSIAEVVHSLLQREDGLCELFKTALFARDKDLCVWDRSPGWKPCSAWSLWGDSICLLWQ